MLIGFSLSNYASWQGHATFSMCSFEGNQEHQFSNTLTQSGQSLVKSALIYGANASGKSNLVQALAKLRQMVLLSNQERNLPEKMQSHRFVVDASKAPVAVEVAFLLNGSLYRYEVKTIGNFIVEENLQQDEKPLLKRDGRALFMDESWEDTRSLLDTMPGDELALSRLAAWRFAPAYAVFGWFERLTVITQDSLSTADSVLFFRKNPASLQRAIDLLQAADTGIESVEIDGGGGVHTTHTLFSLEGRRAGVLRLALADYQSEGTIKLFSLLGPILRAIKDGLPVIIDEMDAKLHTGILRRLVAMFHSPENTAGQLVANLHDPLMLEEKIRPDQVWFVEKDSLGRSQLYSLVDFENLPANSPLTQQYLLGIFGAVPFSKKGKDYE